MSLNKLKRSERKESERERQVSTERRFRDSSNTFHGVLKVDVILRTLASIYFGDMFRKSLDKLYYIMCEGEKIQVTQHTTLLKECSDTLVKRHNVTGSSLCNVAFIYIAEIFLNMKLIYIFI